MAKGSILDLGAVSFWMFVIVLTVFILYSFTTAFNEASADIGLSHTTALDSLETGLEMFDTGILLIFFGASLAIIVGSYKLDADPVFVVVSILTLVFVSIVVAQASNMYHSLAVSEPMTDVVGNFPLMNIIMPQLPVFFAIVGVLVVIALYIRNRRATFV